MNWTHAKMVMLQSTKETIRDGRGLKVQASQNKENLRNYEVNPNYFCFMAMKTVNENVLSVVFSNATAHKKESL